MNPAVTDSADATTELTSLVRLFYAGLGDLATFEQVEPLDMARDYRMLLAHQDHMTVTVERYHGCKVDVEVLDSQLNDRHYVRKILLRRQSDRGVVQFGIVRLDFAFVSEEVRRRVESRDTPLGRILIEHNVFRDVHLSKLWKVTPGEELQRHFGLPSPVPTYGRTAGIDCDGQPAIELLEVVSPLAEVLSGLGIRPVTPS